MASGRRRRKRRKKSQRGTTDKQYLEAARGLQFARADAEERKKWKENFKERGTISYGSCVKSGESSPVLARLTVMGCRESLQERRSRQCEGAEFYQCGHLCVSDHVGGLFREVWRCGILQAALLPERREIKDSLLETSTSA